jgi:hypothetical protein
MRTSSRSHDSAKEKAGLAWRVYTNALLLGFDCSLIGGLSNHVSSNVFYTPVKHLLGPATVDWIAGMGSLNLFLFGVSIGSLYALYTDYTSYESREKIDDIIVKFTVVLSLCLSAEAHFVRD